MPISILGDGTITTPNNKVTTNNSRFLFTGDEIQIVTVQAQTDANHIQITGTSEATLPLTCSITPTSTTSKIQVIWFSNMGYGATSGSDALRLLLYRSTNGGSTYTNLIPNTDSYPPGPFYSWTYFHNTWSPYSVIYFDTPNTTNTITYQLRYRNGAGSGTNTLVHANGQYYGWILSEIG
jgi:hypothetical protein